MKLSKQTVAILNNYSDINQSILVKKGNQLRTISVMKNILAEAKIEEEFPKDFAIYDLPQFLKVLRLHQDPETVSVKIIMSLFEKDVIVHVISLPILT